jgi:acetoin utilization deacetylase AcuC-like enzyme
VDTRDDTVLVPVESNQESGTTSIVTNPLCAQHHTCPPSQVETPSAPPENTKRLHVLVHEEQGALCAADLRDGINWVRTAKPAALADVLRVHEWSYVRRVQEHCASIESADPEDEEGGYAHLDGDTAVSCETYNAALAAAGAVCEAVDLVAGHLPAAGAGARIPRSAFCPVRPPGHHAGPRGLVKSTEPGAPDSHGFCILNNVSIGAAYAMNRYRETVHRVAIVDFGRGTCSPVLWLFKFPYPSYFTSVQMFITGTAPRRLFAG